MEAYVDDMVVKSTLAARPMANLQVVFDTINKYQLKFNLENCSFCIQQENFSTPCSSQRGIKAIILNAL